MHANCIETLQRAGDIAAKNNIEILVENIDPEENPKYFLLYSAEGFDIVRSVGNPHVKFLYDFYHEQIAAGNLIEKLEKNIDLVGLVHIADVPGRQPRLRADHLHALGGRRHIKKKLQQSQLGHDLRGLELVSIGPYSLFDSGSFPSHLSLTFRIPPK